MVPEQQNQKGNVPFIQMTAMAAVIYFFRQTQFLAVIINLRGG